jgi:hypothetical protein
MNENTPHQSFLDTSVLRSLLLGTETYRNYLQQALDSRSPHVSNYVQMEMRRSFLINIIAFYFIFSLEAIPTLNDAISFWNNEFKTSRLKAFIQFLPELTTLIHANQLDSSNPDDKERILYLIGLYIKRFELILRRKFPNAGQDATACTRALIPLQIKLDAMTQGLKIFLEKFEDTKTCREQCRIDQFLLDEHRISLETYIQQAAELKQRKENKGFIEIASSLQVILEGGAKACSCARCGKIGDAVIALDAPRTMQLEHNDRSFDYLCPPIEQPHRLHPSENQVIRSSDYSSPA